MQFSVFTGPISDNSNLRGATTTAQYSAVQSSSLSNFKPDCYILPCMPHGPLGAECNKPMQLRMSAVGVVPTIWLV